jgi:hypothetical protein
MIQSMSKRPKFTAPPVRDPAAVRKALDMRSEGTDFTHDGSDFPCGVAAEVIEHRGYSPIGAVQRHYLLQPALVTPEGVCTGVVVIAGAKGTYVYPSGSDGGISDYIPVGTAPVGTAGSVILTVMGYRISTHDVALLDAT